MNLFEIFQMNISIVRSVCDRPRFWQNYACFCRLLFFPFPKRAIGTVSTDLPGSWIALQFQFNFFHQIGKYKLFQSSFLFIQYPMKMWPVVSISIISQLAKRHSWCFHWFRGKSLLELLVTTFLPKWKLPFFFTRFVSNFLCMCF